MNRGSFSAIASVAYKEFLHIYRDRRVLILLLILPPVFTLVFGHAFEAGEMTNVPAMLVNRDGTPRAERFVELLLKNKTFALARAAADGMQAKSDLLGHGVQAALVIPTGWSDSLANGDPIPLRLYLDGSDTNTARTAEGSVQKTLGDFQLSERQVMIDALPEEVFEMAKKLPVQVRKQFVSMMEPWKAEGKILYNPKDAVHRLRPARRHRAHPATDHRDADGLHDRARARGRNALSIDGDFAAAPRNRDRENHLRISRFRSF